MNRKYCKSTLSRKRLLGLNVSRAEDHAQLESLQRNRISNVSFAVSSAGEIVILAVMVGILKALKSDESTENNTRAFSVLIAFSGGVWRACYYITHSSMLNTYFGFWQCCALYPGSS